MASFINPDRFPDLPIVEADTPICFRSDSLKNMAQRAIESDIPKLTRIVGGAAPRGVTTLAELLRIHRLEMDLLVRGNRDLDYPGFEWQYVPTQRVAEELEIDAEMVTAVIPHALQYGAGFCDIIPDGYLLAASVDTIVPMAKPATLDNQVADGIFSKYHTDHFRGGNNTAILLADIHPAQLVHGTPIVSTEGQPQDPKFYFVDIEPRLHKIGF